MTARKTVRTPLRSCLAAAYSAKVAFGYEGRASVSPLFLTLRDTPEGNKR